jgi:hypothetical protein
MKEGAKGSYESFKIKQRYADLSEPFFKALKEFLISDKEADRKFAISELSKAYTRMIPTELSGVDGGAIVIQVSKEGAEKYDLANSQ